jgi:hypothetical protein
MVGQLGGSSVFVPGMKAVNGYAVFAVLVNDDPRQPYSEMLSSAMAIATLRLKRVPRGVGFASAESRLGLGRFGRFITFITLPGWESSASTE